MDNSLLVDGINIRELNDDELQERLQSYGFNPGPILSTTKEVYQRKLARLMKREEYSDLEEEHDLHIEGNLPESPVLNSSLSYSASPSLSVGDLRRRPLSRVEGESFSETSSIASHASWSVDDIVTQVQPPPDEASQPLMSSTAIIIAIIGVIIFLYLIYNNMESTPQSPFS